MTLYKYARKKIKKEGIPIPETIGALLGVSLPTAILVAKTIAKKKKRNIIESISFGKKAKGSVPLVSSAFLGGAVGSYVGRLLSEKRKK